MLNRTTRTLTFAALVSSMFLACQPKRSAWSRSLSDAESADFYVDKNSKASLEVATMRNEGAAPGDVQKINYIAQHSVAKWFDKAEVIDQLPSYMAEAKEANKAAVLVVYQIPGRDCGGASAGGADSAEKYEAWIEKFAKGIGDGKAIVVLEPDGLPLTFYCEAIKKDPSKIKERTALLNQAGILIKNNAPNAKVYLDAGHSEWPNVDQIVPLLKDAGVANIDGFTLNVSNYKLEAALIARGKEIRAQLGGKANFIIDTSRNGNANGGGATGGHWCNPPNSRLGRTSQWAPANSNGLDAYVWIKLPGESDGSKSSDATCGEAPAAGEFSRKIALELAADIKGQQQQQQSSPKQRAPEPKAPAPQHVPAPIPAPVPNVETIPGPVSGGESGSLSADIVVKSDWGTGYCADIMVKNRGGSAVSTWTVTLDKNGQSMQGWNFNVEDRGAEVVLKPVADWISAIAAGESKNVGGFCVYQGAQSRIQIKSVQ